jgi:hypothetical protein
MEPGGLEQRADLATGMRQVRVRPAEDRGRARVGRGQARIRSVVVLPAPFGPRNPVTAPAGTANERSSTAACPS